MPRKKQPNPAIVEIERRVLALNTELDILRDLRGVLERQEASKPKRDRKPKSRPEAPPKADE